MTKKDTTPKDAAEPKIETPIEDALNPDVLITTEAKKRIQRYISDLEDAIRYKIEENEDYEFKIKRMQGLIEKNRAKILEDKAVVQILKGKL